MICCALLGADGVEVTQMTKESNTFAVGTPKTPTLVDQIYFTLSTNAAALNHICLGGRRLAFFVCPDSSTAF